MAAQYSFAQLEPSYAAWWNQLQIRPEQRGNAKTQALKIMRGRARYETVEKRTGVKWWVVGILHMRESSCDFNTWLHNGDPMRDRNGRPIRTVHKTANRPPNPNCSWEDGAYDALVVVQGFEKIKSWTPARVGYVLESFNGFGYRNPTLKGGAIPSPYVVGATTAQKIGKYVSDGVYSNKEWDTQIGGFALLKLLMELDAGIAADVAGEIAEVDGVRPAAPAPVAPVAPVPAPVPVPATPPQSPKATDAPEVIRPPGRSRIMWGGILTGASAVGSTTVALIHSVNNPYTLSALVIVAVAAAVGLYMVSRGYLDVRKLVTHLLPDDGDTNGGA